jgi:hypothetical protein
MKTGLIVDVSNLYFAINLAHAGRKLMMLDYAKHLEDLGHDLAFKVAYSRQSANSAQSFTHMLNCHGFETHFGTGPWLVPMTLRAAEIIPEVNCLIIGSNDEQFCPVFAYARKAGRKTKCFAVTIPAGMKKHAECIEVPESLMANNATPSKTK